MTQNTPPGQPGHADDRFDRGDPLEREPGPNPYYASQQAAQAPDLDANAPFLESSDVQRLNRKALMFLAGIVALLVVAIVWMFRSATAGEEPVAKPREKAVVVPELPQALPQAPASRQAPVDPIALAPPLPDVADAGAPLLPPGYDIPAAPSGPTLMERRMMATGNGDATAQGRGAQPNALEAYARAQQAVLASASGQQQPESRGMGLAEVSSARFIHHPDALLVRGTFIRCVLETRIITDVPGFTSCIVTEPVYSINGRSLLLPKGSKVYGSYDTDATGPRIAVIWDRITTPNGIDVDMSSPGVDNLGSAGHPGDYNAHWASRMSAALMISLVADAFKYAAAEHGPQSSTIGAGGVVVQSPYESATARTMERLAGNALQRSMNRPATVTINQGTVVNVYVARDVDFSGVLARN